MFDTLRLFYPIDSGININHILGLLTNQKETITELDKSFSGNYKSLHIRINQNGISIVGSLAKFSLPNNINTLTRSSAERAFYALSDELCLDVAKSKVYRIDFAQNLIMKCSPEMYYPYLGVSNHYQRVINPHSLYFNNKLRQKVFYDKIEESKIKGVELPLVVKNQNLLRYELRYLSRISNQFNTNEILVKDLYKEEFYIKLFDNWFSEFNNITKVYNQNMSLENPKTEKGFIENLATLYVLEHGQSKIFEMIEELKSQKVFENPEYYSRLKGKINEMVKVKPKDKPQLLIELEQKIKQAKEYYR